MPEPIPIECQPIADEIKEIEAEIKDLQADLKNETGPLKWAILRQIAALVRKKHAKGVELRDCIVRNGGTVCNPLAAIFTGTATLRTSYQRAPGPFVDPVTLDLWFGCPRNSVQIVTFPAIVTQPYDTGTIFGTNFTTITMIAGGGGVFNSSSGEMAIPIKLSFDQSIDIPLVIEDSTVDFLLSTGLVASPVGDVSGSSLDPAGRITLVGASQFKDGILGGSYCTLVIEGIISPHP